MGTDQERHRPGLLKQQNKAHKHGRHRSKHAIQVAEKGRTSLKTVSKKFKRSISKHEKRSQMNQSRLKKRLEVLKNKRQLGDSKTPPFLIAVIPLSFNTDLEKLMKLVKSCCEDNHLAVSQEGILHLT